VPFDVYGRNENYFVNNVWGWHPLWQFACEHCPDVLTQEDLELGSFNQGHFINAEKATRLGEQLLQCCVSGVAEAYEKERQQKLDALPDEVCQFCHGTGKRHDQYVDGTCNCCHGKGNVPASAKKFLFHAKNVRKFAEFCLASGGFEIW
jgi:DnaJ-class molecular chaperone